jgi:hypothetical protein
VDVHKRLGNWGYVYGQPKLGSASRQVHPVDERQAPRRPGRLATIAKLRHNGHTRSRVTVAGIVTIVIVWALFGLHKLNILSAVSRTP